VNIEILRSHLTELEVTARCHFTLDGQEAIDTIK